MSFPAMVALGFVGSLHCVGMCGGLVGALTLARPGIGGMGLACYQVGRVTTYAALGLAAGVLGDTLGELGAVVPRLLALLAGMVMIAFGLHMAGWIPDPLRRLTGSPRGPLIRLASAATRHPAPWRGYALGLANGLLPCGLVYAALGLALATGDPARSATMMAGFGLGTVPAMVLAPLAMKALTPTLRHTGMRVLGVMVILLGILTLTRAAISP